MHTVTVTVTYLNITFGAEGTSDEISLWRMAKQLVKFVDCLIEVTSIVGHLHYYAHYSDGTNQRITLQKDEIHMIWGYTIEKFLYTWRIDL